MKASERRSVADKLAWATLIALAAWAGAPIVYLLLRAAAHHETFSGGDSIFPGDQLQYLAWIRSSGEHGLAADDFDLRGGGHVLLHPMFFLSGLLWRAGMGIALSYLVWLPVAVGVLFVGFRRYTRRMLRPAFAQTAALVLALFFVTPANPLIGWTGRSVGLGILAGQLSPTGALDGYFPAAIAVGLMPLFALCLEQIVEPGQRRSGRSQGWYVGWSAVLGMAVAWLHPWQGETLLVLIGVLLVIRQFGKRHLPLLVPAVARPLRSSTTTRSRRATSLGRLRSRSRQ